MLNKSAALTLFKSIPAVSVVYTDTHDGFVSVLLDQTKGLTRDEPPQDFYRVWMAAYRYLQQHPALHRVKKHDKTELGNYESPLEMLLEQQATEDAINDLVIPSGQGTSKAEKHYTVSLRVSTEFM